MFNENPEYQLNIEDLKKDKVFWTCWTVMIIALFIFIFSVAESHAQIIQPADVREAASILYAESASDPQGWVPKLNTYYKGKQIDEALVAHMKQVSSAYRTKSPQYRKAVSGQLNSYERKVFNRIIEVTKTFRPDPTWPYFHHENLKLYPSKKIALAHLKKAWGNDVDFGNCQQFGKEYYFGKCK